MSLKLDTRDNDNWLFVHDYVREKLGPIVSARCGQHIAVAELIRNIGEWAGPHIWALYGAMRSELASPIECFATDRDMVGPEFADTIDDSIYGLSRGIVTGPTMADTGRIIRLATGRDYGDDADDTLESTRHALQCPVCGHHTQRYHAISNAGRVSTASPPAPYDAMEELGRCFARVDHMTMGVK